MYGSFEVASSCAEPSKATPPSRSIRNSVPATRDRSATALNSYSSPRRYANVRATLKASRSWCVTRMDVTPPTSRTLTTRSVIVVAVIGSRPVVGSSYSISPGRAASARATATRRRCPPDSSEGIRS